MSKERKPLRVRVTAVIELDPDAQDAWSASFGVENTPAALRDDVRTYALDCPVGGPDVMRAQLAHLLDLSNQPNVSVRVVPRSAGAHVGLDGAFKVMTVDEGDVAYTEAHGGGRLVLSAQEVRSFSVRYDRVGVKALPEEASRNLIREIMEDMK